jgi:hypothetical protein
MRCPYQAQPGFSTQSYIMSHRYLNLVGGEFSGVISKDYCSRHGIVLLSPQPGICKSSATLPLGAGGKAALPERYGCMGQHENRGLSFQRRAVVWSN